MRIRTLILVAIAVVLAGGTAMMARAWLNAQKSRTIAVAAPMSLPPPSKSVLVAHHPIARGEILKSGDFAWEAWPNSGIANSYVQSGGKQSPASFAGWVARYPMAAGEPITESKVVAPGSRGFLAAVLRPGMRAVSVEVNATTGISGFVFPGDQVDILITYSVPSKAVGGGGASQYQHKAAETILHNIRVLGIDQRLQTKNGQALLARTATLEVTPKQSEIIALASEMGKLSLSLRSLAKPSAPQVAQADSTVFDAPPTVTPVSATAAAPSESPAADSLAPVAGTTYTLDSEISPLLPKPFSEKDKSKTDVVTILRGDGKSSESSGAQAASRGS